jgi:heat shock protein HslJ
MRTSGLAAPAALGLFLSACGFSIPIRPPIEPSRWNVIAINRQPTPASESYQVAFQNGQFSGRLGCNSFGGAYQVRGGVMTVGPVNSTEMACPEPAITHERLGFAALGAPLQMVWSHSGARLTLAGPAGTITLSKIGYRP